MQKNMTKTPSSPFNAVLFDLDGTLVDTAPDFVLAGNELRERYNMPPMAYVKIAEQVSNGAAVVTATCMEITNDHTNFESLRQELLELYAKHLGTGAIIYPHLNELLIKLESENIHWGVVTNKPFAYAEPLLEKLELSSRNGVLICPDHVSKKKPDPESVLLAAKKINCAPENCIYVGDHQRDVAAGNSANMLTIAVGYGYLTEQENPSLWEADNIANTPKELSDIVQQLVSI